jgi:hypothetical protein
MKKNQPQAAGSPMGSAMRAKSVRISSKEFSSNMNSAFGSMSADNNNNLNQQSINTNGVGNFMMNDDTNFNALSLQAKVSLLEKDIERRSLSIKKQTKPVSD